MSEKNFEVDPRTDSDNINYLRLQSTNAGLELRMEIEPEFDFESNRYLDNSVFISFINTRNDKPIGLGGGVFKITSADIPELDVSDREKFEKSFTKYANTFTDIKPGNMSGDNFDYLIRKIFSDILEKRAEAK